VDSTYGQRIAQLEMPLQSDVNVGTDAASYLAARLARPMARVSSVSFVANASPEKMEAALLREPGDRVAVTEDMTGLVGDEFIITGVRWEIRPGVLNTLWCTWALEPADTQRYWLMGIPGASEIGVSTVAGY
jgi:hypothetical protein